MKVRSLLFAASLVVSSAAGAQDAVNPAIGPTPEVSKAVANDGGAYTDKDGNPTYNITPEGKVDYYTYKGYVMYHAECHVCHGPDAMGSTYAPALKDSLKRIDYYKFLEVVASGQKNTANVTGEESVMPAFGDNRNVMCVADEIYVYLRARADGVLPRGRPQEHEVDKKAQKAIDDCLG